MQAEKCQRPCKRRGLESAQSKVFIELKLCLSDSHAKAGHCFCHNTLAWFAVRLRLDELVVMLIQMTV